MPTLSEEFGEALRTQASSFRVQLSDDVTERMGRYYQLLLKWNARLHLVAPCSPLEFATRHVLESLLLLDHLPPGASAIDIGSGAGLPIIPCLIARSDLRAILIESSQRKTVFLHEALREVGCGQQAQLIGDRFERMSAPQADFVSCRALDRFSDLLPVLIDWSPPNSTLLLFAGELLRKEIEALLPWARAERIPQSERRFLIVAPRHAAN